MNKVSRIGSIVVALTSLGLVAREAQAQVPPPDKKQIFIDDTQERRDQEKRLREKALEPVAPASDELDFQAPKLEFNREANEVIGSGGLTVSQGGVQVQSDQGRFNLNEKTGKFEGNVVMTTPEGTFASDIADLNLDSETGDFTNANFTIEEGGYDMRAATARKISEFEFTLDEANLSTCHCADGARPWEIVSSSCNITQEGYAHTYNTKFYFEGVPVLYTPWMAFPVKTERASGLLVPEYGYSSRDGFRYSQPLFLVLDDSTDVMLTPFLETRTRVGSGVGFRKAFSTQSNIDSRMIYSNEARRQGDLRGLDITGYADPQIDTNRFGGFYRHQWRPDPERELPIEFLVDGHYASDDLFIREIEDEDIGDREAQYLTSVAVARGVFWSQVTAEARTEYNQMIVQSDDTQFQRLPELAVSSSKTLRPFGFNPYGVKLIASGAITATDFTREDGYDGWRTNIRPRATVPFHIENYVRGQFAAELHQTEYSLNNTIVPNPGVDSPSELEDSSSRTLPIFGYGMSTGVERVYDLERDNWFSNLIGLGAENEGLELTRLKHTMEPSVQYTYIPFVEQDDQPFFDNLDRFRERSLFTYGLTQRLYGRMLRPYERSREVGELAPSPETLPSFDLGSSLLEFGRGMTILPDREIDRREGEIRELVTFAVKQSYDYIEDERDEQEPNVGGPNDRNELERTAFSDVNLGLALSPSQYMAVGFSSDVDYTDQTFSRYDVGVGFRDDRGDVLRTRYSFVNQTDVRQPLSQIEGNLEIALTERLRAGYYARYDDVEHDMLESKALLRFINACKCWSVDIGFKDQTNPDKQQFLLTFTFAGLGDITQDIGLPEEENQAQ